ncbi:hypothetical protein CkaCkLH20_08262 [Colletotrichum karsti]|uniref:Fe2OG dioxygenase domain-containing protein n=1 Tax=Colletotrichum karsti TaxID=1095194 RepID=A0A9P6I108_9PEZI|nr:uncharacterized protein CkaCkLH20_08262 [Colletotrichum karsti]KAF9874279.1 hypothetical protein CkaCkLH20_08262 [Colletotrichum karsti]
MDHAIPKFTQHSPTTEALDYVDLVELDLASFDNSATREKLAEQLLDAVINDGFFALSNHGIPEDVYSSQVDLAHAVLSIPDEEKKQYETPPHEDARGRYVGFKPAGGSSSKACSHKTLDHYNVPAWDLEIRKHPPLLQPYLNQVSTFMELIRQKVLSKLLTLVSLVLEVPEERIISTHAPELETTDYLRYVLYNPRPANDSQQYRDLYLAGHTDLGSFTFLFSQPVSSLQIRTLAGDWKWVPYLPGRLIVNVGEALELMMGGLFRATVHRAVKPPADQERAKRIGVMYFARPSNGQRLEPIDSPLLRRMGIDKPLDVKVYTMADYPYARKHGCKRLDFDQGKPRRQRLQDMQTDYVDKQPAQEPGITT